MKHHVTKSLLIVVILLITNMLQAQNQLSGTVNYHEDASNPLPDVTVNLFDNSDNLVATTITNVYGEFVFSNLPSDEYHLQSETTLPIGDVNLIDASLILQYLFGMYSFNDYEFNAADVNESGTVTFTDYFLVLISYLMQGAPFPAGDWQFNDVYVNLTSRDTIPPVTVWGTSTGDVEGIWLPAGRNIGNLSQENNDVTINDNEIINLEIGSDYNDVINGFNLNLTYPINSIEIVDVTGPDENFHFDIDENSGILKVIWLDENKKSGTKFFGEKLFSIKVKPLAKINKTNDVGFSLLEGGMLLDNNSNEVENATITLPTLTNNSYNFTFDIVTFPNPVTNNLNMKITSPNETSMEIFIYDMTGRVVKTEGNINVYKGIQLININTDDLNSGQYFYGIKIQGSRNMMGSFSKVN